ncbi:MAG: hypothetical protein GKR98_07420 [Boseongicola sp.]|nr:MAG: hypothetical protein GKR98_07420 [Boseongicola sp.]
MVGVIVVTAFLSLPAFSAQIEKACLLSDRGAGNRALCGCIQDAANMTLSAKDQRLAATFFSDPHRAQQIRQSGRRTHERFWERYQSFGETAEVFCRG